MRYLHETDRYTHRIERLMDGAGHYYVSISVE